MLYLTIHIDLIGGGFLNLDGETGLKSVCWYLRITEAVDKSRVSLSRLWRMDTSSLPNANWSHFSLLQTTAGSLTTQAA